MIVIFPNFKSDEQKFLNKSVEISWGRAKDDLKWAKNDEIDIFFLDKMTANVTIICQIRINCGK